MKAIITGATGMIGQGVLLECLDHPKVTEVLTIGRSKVNLEHPKLKQIEHADFTDFSDLKDQLGGYDACFFCLGVSAAGMSEENYRKISYDFTMAMAKTLYELNPEMTFTFVTGQGADSTEKGRIMWARVKGKTENDLLSLGFKKAIMFRPGMIVPKRGIVSRTPAYRFMYRYFMWLVKLVQFFSPNSVTDTTRMGKAMINAHFVGEDQSILRPKDINELAAKNV